MSLYTKNIYPYKILNQMDNEVCGGYAVLGMLQQYTPNINLKEVGDKLDNLLSEGKHVMTAPAIKNWFVPNGYFKDLEYLNPEDAVEVLRKGHPVLIGGNPIDWSKTGQAPYHVVFSDNSITGHFWYAVEITYENIKQGVCIVKCVNSWGENWGDKGHFYMNILDKKFTYHRIVI